MESVSFPYSQGVGLCLQISSPASAHLYYILGKNSFIYSGQEVHFICFGAEKVFAYLMSSSFDFLRFLENNFFF